MAGRRICYILALAGCVGFYIAYQKWFAWIVLLTVLFLPWFSLLLSLRAMLCLKLRLTLPERITQGADINIRLDLHGTGIRPPFVCRIRVSKPCTGENWILRPGDALPTEHCGGLSVRVEKAKVYDFLGLFRIKIKKPPVSMVRVLPEKTELPIPEEITHVLARAWKPKHGGGYAENHEIRPYRPGDTLNLVHWKLSAKADALMLREPMEPEQGMMLLTMDLQGTPTELDRKFSRLLCYGQYLIRHGAAFEVIALTGNGIETWFVREESEFSDCVDALLCTPFAPEGTIRERKRTAVWQYHIGGEPDEA